MIQSDISFVRLLTTDISYGIPLVNGMCNYAF
jgi:hypothetical protein